MLTDEEKAAAKVGEAMVTPFARYCLGGLEPRVVAEMRGVRYTRKGLPFRRDYQKAVEAADDVAQWLGYGDWVVYYDAWRTDPAAMRRRLDAAP